MKRPTLILAVLVSLALPPSAQGLSTRELEERCPQPTLEGREECQQAITKREGEERTEREEQEGRKAAEAAFPGGCEGPEPPAGHGLPFNNAYESTCASLWKPTVEAREREKSKAEEAEYATAVSKDAEEALADGGGVACVVTNYPGAGNDASMKPDPEERAAEVLARCRTLLAEKVAAAWSQPVGVLLVYVQSHKGHSSKTPGYTTLTISVSQFAHVRFTIRRHGHQTYDYVANQPGSAPHRSFPFKWSCESPSGIYQYTVEAWTGKDKEVRHGNFKPVSTEWCRTTARQEREAQKRKDREWREAAEREHAAFVREEREAEENCRKLGGTVVTIHGDAGPVRVCRSPEAYVPLSQQSSVAMARETRFKFTDYDGGMNSHPTLGPKGDARLGA
jgi:hypothetical protein